MEHLDRLIHDAFLEEFGIIGYVRYQGGSAIVEVQDMDVYMDLETIMSLEVNDKSNYLKNKVLEVKKLLE